jgi:hypothetical protein
MPTIGNDTMRQTSFVKLLKDVCHLAKIAAPDRFRDDAQLEIGGTAFTLIDGSETEADTLAYFCDFGAVPHSADRADILQRLLECNLLMFGVGTPTFSINYENNHVLLMGRASLRDVDAARLLATFSKYAEQAAQWRKTYFLEPVRSTQPRMQSRLLGMQQRATA